ncbi:MAG: hypothetical protein D6725_09665 [Planctomycetota bacterium]|nr:MAG: hypothetical protein D6725_09665 [Planctomycetota bacterium]
MTEPSNDAVKPSPRGGEPTSSRADHGDGAANRAVIHRLRNELYSATLALRTVIALIDRGQAQAARAAAERMLEQLCGPMEDVGPTASTTKHEDDAGIANTGDVSASVDFRDPGA